MANPTCTKAQLNVACFRGLTLNPLQRKALLIYFYAAQLNAIGGTNYLTGLISGMAGGLIGDTKALMDEKSSVDDVGTRMVGTFQLAIALKNAEALGVASASIQVRMQNIKCLINVNESLMDRMLLFLECQLGVPKSYPQ